MPSYQKRGNKWRVQVRRKGVNRSATFYTKSEAREWATEIEREIDTGRLAARSRATVGAAMSKYAAEVSQHKRGRRWEQIRLAKLQHYPLADVRFIDLTPEHIANWRDQRLLEVSPSSVRREMNLLSSVINTARREWCWTDVNPCRDVAKPKERPPRDKRMSDEDIDRLCLALGYAGGVPTTSSQRVAVMLRLAIETAMRLGEMCAIQVSDIHYAGRYVRLHRTKNSDRRDVPLSKEAMRLLRLAGGERRVFPVSPSVASALFARAKKACELDLTFHDSRHEACTRLARKIDVLELARMIGHRDPRSLMHYFNARPHEIASRLDVADESTVQHRSDTTGDDARSAPAPESRACK